MPSAPSRFPLLQVMGSNAFLLSAVYLVLGLLVELGRRYLPSSTLGAIAMRASLVLDALPARLLDSAGLLDSIRASYLDGGMTEFGIRLAFSFTTVLLIFALAIGTGLALAGLRRLVLRRSE